MRTKVWLIIAASLVLIGCILLDGVMTKVNWDFTKLSTGKYVNNVHEIHENFQNISIVTDTADVVFVPCENQTPSVSCYEQENNIHSVCLKDGTLVIETVDTRKWHEYIGITLDTPKITVSIPEGQYGMLSVKASTAAVIIPKDFSFSDASISLSTGDVTIHASVSDQIKIKTSTGDICVENISAGALDLTVSTGRVTVSDVICNRDIAVGVSTGKAYLTNIQCKNLTSTGNTGDISLQKVIATEKLSIERSTGDVTFDHCDAAEICVKTETGDVSGTLLSNKVFIAKTDAGRVIIPNSSEGGRCEITTDTGNINIMID